MKGQLKEIITSFRALQKRNRAVSFVGGIKVSLLESHLLTEVDLWHSIGVNELAYQLCIPKQEASRLARRLLIEGCLEIDEHEDARFRPLALSESGRRIVADIDARANPLLLQIFAVLSSREVTQFATIIRRISDALDVPPFAISPD